VAARGNHARRDDHGQMSRPLARQLLATLLALFAVRFVAAQHCADESSIKARLDTQTENGKADFIAEMEKAQFFGSVLRWSAVAGPSIIPVLRIMTRPDMNFNSIPGEAQISLAKLGDETALKELDYELNHSEQGGYAVEKLIHVGTDKGFSLLVAFLRAHISDSSLQHEYGDYGDDLRWHIVAGLSALASDSPTNADPAHPYNAWLDWWQNRNGRVALSISGQVGDPYLACLARKVEWGFPDAILDMANAGNPDAMPILRILEHIGAPIYTLNAVPGRAQFALAKLGDEQAFGAIKKALDEYGSSAALDMLWKLGGKSSVKALLDALDSSFPREPHGVWPPPSPADKRNYAAYQKSAAKYKDDTDEALLRALNSMVANPPYLTGDLASRKKQWQEWWAKNKDAAQFVTAKLPSYE
jgi:hypothetical protein